MGRQSNDNVDWGPMAAIGAGTLASVLFGAAFLWGMSIFAEARDRSRERLQATAPQGCVVEQRHETYDCGAGPIVPCDKYVNQLVCDPSVDMDAAKKYLQKHDMEMVVRPSDDYRNTQ